MRIAKLYSTAAVLGLLLATTVPVQAHHSDSAEFNLDKTLEMTGILTKVEWINPHGWFYFDVKAPDGNIEQWAIETHPPSGWRRVGILSKGVFVIGDTYKMQVSPAKNGTKTALLGVLVFSNGRRISMLGPAQENPGSN